MRGVVLLYIIAVLTLYHHSWWIKTLLNIIAIPIWLILLIHLSQYLPVTYRLAVVTLAIALTILGLTVDLKEYLQQNLARKSINSSIKRREDGRIYFSGFQNRMNMDDQNPFSPTWLEKFSR